MITCYYLPVATMVLDRHYGGQAQPNDLVQLAAGLTGRKHATLYPLDWNALLVLFLRKK